MAIRVFISHSTSPDPDKTIEPRLREQLPAQAKFRKDLCAKLDALDGIKCFVDAKTRTGDQWREVLFGEMDDCNAAVILVNELALTCSDWVDTEARILCWRAWVEKKNFRLVIVPFGGITPARIAEHRPWAAIAPREIQMLPRGGDGLDIANTNAVTEVFDDIVTTLRSMPGADPSASSWIVNALGSFLSNDPEELKRVAGKLELPVQGNRQLSKRDVAKRLYELGPEAIRAFLDVRPNALDTRDLRLLLRLLNTNWVDPRASAAILPFCTRDAARRVFALNAKSHTFTPKTYIEQLLTTRVLWPVIPVADTRSADVVIEQIRKELTDSFREALLVDLPNPDSAKPDVLDSHLNGLIDDRIDGIDGGDPVFVTLSSVATDSHDLIEKIHHYYPNIKIVLCTAQSPRGERLPGIETLEPEIDLAVEDNARRTYRRTKSSRTFRLNRSDMAQTKSDYKPLVRLKDIEDFRSADDRDVQGDRRDGKLYRYTDNIRLYVNVALATGRPLLLLGPTGCGKSSLAFNLARKLRRRYYEFVVTSRSEARDLFYRFDAVRRLADANTRGADTQGYHPYIEPGPLWWILDKPSALRRGRDAGAPEDAIDPALFSPPGEVNPAAVLLIDEIDKAEPDFPNNLLVPLGSRQFAIEEISKTLELEKDGASSPERAPLVVITSNRERELPEAFVRRCIVLEIPAPEVEQLVELGTAVIGPGREEQLRTIAQTISNMRGPARLSTAEFLDAVRAIDRLQAKDSMLSQIVASTTWRPQDLEP